MNLPSPTFPNLVYARIEQRALTLDLYLPQNPAKPTPLLIWIHGGAWRVGDKSWCHEALPLLDHGYAIASVGYRLSQEARFPAQIRDVKAAVRWLRLNAAEWGLDSERFAAAGSSAGGHLAALLGVSFYKKEWDKTGEYSESTPETISSAVQAVIDWYGPTDFLRMNDQPGDMDHFAADSPESQLLGAPIHERPDLVAAANPISYVYPGFPPFLILHGDQDGTVLPIESILLHEALQKWGSYSELVFIPGAGHGFEGSQFQQAIEKASAFLEDELRNRPAAQMIYYASTPDTFRPRTRNAVRWLSPHTDYDQVRAYWNLIPSNNLSLHDWLDAHDQGYSYAAIVQDEKILSMAGVLRYSEAAWELASVSTNAPESREGMATSVSSFITKYILGMNRIATTRVGKENTAMQEVVEGIGYRRV